MHDYASKEHVVSALKKGTRIDGRKPDEYRPIQIELDCIRNAEGSCKITCGDTVLLAGVKFSVGKPFPDSPDKGVLIVNAELLPISNSDFEPGPPSIDSIEHSRVIDRGIRESGAFDEKSLCITEGEEVWMVNLDICPLNTDGHLFDIGGLAGLAAMKTAKLPKLADGKPDYKELTDKTLDISDMPVPVTVCKLGDVLIVDPTFDEWKLVDARLTVTTLSDGTLCAMQKGGDAPLSVEDIERMTDIAVEKGKELRKELEKAL